MAVRRPGGLPDGSSFNQPRGVVDLLVTMCAASNVWLKSLVAALYRREVEVFGCRFVPS